MPPFEIPSPPFRFSQQRIWNSHVEASMRSPELLWGVYWKRYNTVEVPLFQEDEYFDIAIAVAKLAKNQEEFERLFEERKKQQWEELLDSMVEAANQTIYHKEIFPCMDARNTVRKVCRTGCLIDFLQLLKSNAFGWKADAVRDAQADEAPKSLSEETHGSTEEKLHSPLDLDSKISADSDRPNPVINDDVCETIFPDLDYGLYWTQMEFEHREQSANTPLFSDTHAYSPCAVPISRKNDLGKRTQTMQGRRKRVRFDDDDDDDGVDDHGYQHQDLEHSVSGSIYHDCSSAKQKIYGSTSDGGVTSEKPRSNGIGRGPKRRKLEHPTTCTSTPHVSSSIRLAADDVISRKRSRDNDDHNYEHKRRKFEGSTARAPASHASSIPKIEDERETKKKFNKKSNNSGKRKSSDTDKIQKRSPAPKNTRSTRRNILSSLWELDHSGKPHSI